MRYTVLLHESPDNGYIATAPVFPGCVGRGQTQEEALNGIRQAIVAELANVIEVTAVEVDVPTRSSGGNPWLDTAGMFKDDPLFDDMLREVEVRRKSGNEEAF